MITLQGQTYAYSRCDCCPQHMWWRHQGAPNVCRKCWNDQMEYVVLDEAMAFTATTNVPVPVITGSTA